LPAALAICVDNGEAGVVNVDAANGYRNPVTDPDAFRCRHDKLPEVKLAL